MTDSTFADDRGLQNMLSASSVLKAIIDTSDSCIKILDAHGRLQFMNLGGMVVMEVDDFSTVADGVWTNFWCDPYKTVALNALEAAKKGGTGNFEGQCATAKGKMKWWNVRVTSFIAENGNTYFLSISRDITALKSAQEQIELIQLELQHRIKNMYAVVQSVVSSTLRSTDNVKDADKALRERLTTLSNSHALLTTDSKTASIEEIIEAAVIPCSIERGRRVHLKGPTVQIAPKPALALGMALHELCTNAVKYGSLSNESGKIMIDWDVVEENKHQYLKLSWQENDGPAVTPPTRKGFGSILIQRGLSMQVEGDVDLDFPVSGLLFKFKAPLANLQTAPAVDN